MEAGGGGAICDLQTTVSRYGRVVSQFFVIFVEKKTS